MLMTVGLLAGCKTGFEDVWSDSSHPQTKLFWALGYNEVRSSAPVHIHFAEALPSNYSGSDTDWDWQSWKAETESLLKKELFPLIGAYEHYYFLIDYEGYDTDGENHRRQPGYDQRQLHGHLGNAHQ